MAKKKRTKKKDESSLFMTDNSATPNKLPEKEASKPAEPLATDSMTENDFLELLEKPLVTKSLPSDFDKKVEAKHLFNLYQNISRMREYEYKNFVHAGGSGLVFKVFLKKEPTTPLALKVVRHNLYKKEFKNPNVAQGLSPISEAELRALEIIHHPNVVRLYDTIGEDWPAPVFSTSCYESIPHVFSLS